MAKKPRLKGNGTRKKIGVAARKSGPPVKRKSGKATRKQSIKRKSGNAIMKA